METKNKIKIIIIIITVLLMSLLGILLIIFINNDKNNELYNSIGTVTANENVDTLTNIKNGQATLKEIEDYFIKDKNNEEIRSIYYYKCAKYYENSKHNESVKGMSNEDKIKYYMMRISPDYNMAISKEMIEFGIKTFGNDTEWRKQYEIGKKINDRQSKIYNGDYDEAIKVYKYIEQKYLEYYIKNGEEADDEYSSQLFEEVSEKFSITILEANDIWCNQIMKVSEQIKNNSSNNYNSSTNSSKNANQRITEDEKGNAVAIAQHEIKDRLKSPSSAKFPWSFDEYSITKSGKTFTVNSYVEAKNSFGTLLKINYQIKFTMTGYETYTVDSIVIDE